jgi:hypothetical protein
MTDLPAATPGDDTIEASSTAAATPIEKRHRRTMLSTGFSDVPGKTCAICGFQGFKWQSTCPEGHPLD